MTSLLLGKPKIHKLPGLVAWFDGGDSASITITGSGVSQWNDKSGNGRHATQGTDADRPGYSPGDYGLEFDGTEWLATAATDILQNVSEYTVFCACQVNAASADFSRIIAVDNGSSRPFRWYLIPGPPRRMRAYSNLADDGNANSENNSSGDAEDVRAVKSAVFTSSDGTIRGYRNGILDEAQTAGNTGQNTKNITGALGIGARANGDSDLSGLFKWLFLLRSATSTLTHHKTTFLPLFWVMFRTSLARALTTQ